MMITQCEECRHSSGAGSNPVVCSYLGVRGYDNEDALVDLGTCMRYAPPVVIDGRAVA